MNKQVNLQQKIEYLEDHISSLENRLMELENRLDVAQITADSGYSFFKTLLWLGGFALAASSIIFYSSFFK